MALKRLKGSKNYLYAVRFGVEIDAVGALADEAYYQVTAAAAAGSAFASGVRFPGGLTIGRLFYNKPAVSLVSGDKVRKLELVKLAFVTDIPNQSAKQKFEDTTQIDEGMSYYEDDKPDRTGTISGYFFSGDPAEDSMAVLTDILNRFYTIAEDTGSALTSKPITTGPLPFMLGRNETTDVGDYEIMEFMPMIMDQLNMDKPMKGNQNFNFGYTVVASEYPCLYRRKITA